MSNDLAKREQAIKDAFDDFRDSPGFRLIHEHGREWIVEDGTGGQWSVADSVDLRGKKGFIFEVVTEPDEEELDDFEEEEEDE